MQRKPNLIDWYQILQSDRAQQMQYTLRRENKQKKALEKFFLKKLEDAQTGESKLKEQNEELRQHIAKLRSLNDNLADQLRVVQEAVRVIGVSMHDQKQKMIRERDLYAQSMARERKTRQALEEKIRALEKRVQRARN